MLARRIHHVYHWHQARHTPWLAPAPRRFVSVWARADLQSISGVPGCPESHSRPVDPRTGLPVHLWELTCPAHEARICGQGKQKVMLWERDGNGGFSQRWVAPMEPAWARSADEIPLTPDQLRAETKRNSLTRRAEQAALAEGITNTRLALEYRPAAKEILRARALGGRGAVKMATCHSCHSDYLVGAVYCPQCAVRVSVPEAADVPVFVVDVPQVSQDA